MRNLAADGLNQSQIARRTGIPRLTVSGWLRAPPRRHLGHVSEQQQPVDAAAYSYLLGMYLGDGHLARFPRAWALRIALDSRYPGIVAECVEAVRAVVPGNAVGVIPHPEHNCVRVQAYSRRWPALLPQHGAGRKHERVIALAEWQLRDHDRVSAGAGPRPHPLRRLPLHQPGAARREGLRVSALHVLQPVARHPRDLHRPPRSPRHRVAVVEDHTISIARRAAVARLDEFVGRSARPRPARARRRRSRRGRRASSRPRRSRPAGSRASRTR